MHIYNIVQELKSASGKNAKLDILKQHADNDILKEWFRLTIDRRINFFQKKEILAEALGTDDSWYAISEFMQFLVQIIATREITGNAANEAIFRRMMVMGPKNLWLAQRLLSKKPDCGVDTAANKVWPKLIPELPCMLAKPYSDKLADKLPWKTGVWSELKSDGLRAHFVITEGSVIAYTRAMNELDLQGRFDFLAEIPDLVGQVLDGELLSVDDNGEFMDRKTSNGIGNKAVKGTLSKAEAAKMHLVAWDAIPVDDFWSGEFNVPYEKRKVVLTGLISSIRDRDEQAASLIPGKIVFSKDEAQLHYQEMQRDGEEGTMLKDPRQGWVDKRVATILKLKAELTADLRVVGIIPGEGKYSGMIGALQCATDDGSVEVNVGTGLSDDDRARGDWWMNKIVEVTYNEIITSKGKTKPSLFLPRVKQVREDKTSTNI